MNNLSKLIPALIVIALVAAGGAGYFYFQYQKAQKEIQTIKTDSSNTQKAAQEEVKRLIGKVGQLIELPKEEPTVFTVADVEKLKNQPFFAKAKNGDKVLIYANAKKAILYNEAMNKILDVAPINIGTSSAQAELAKILLRNGTTTPGLATKVENDIKKSFPDANIVDRENADKTDYEKTVIIALTDKAKDAADSLAKTLKVSVGKLPEGESKPQDMDILVIIGKDKI